MNDEERWNRDFWQRQANEQARIDAKYGRTEKSSLSCGSVVWIVLTVFVIAMTCIMCLSGAGPFGDGGR